MCCMCMHACMHDIKFPYIIFQAWDDVVRKVKPVEKPFDYTRAKPLDQEKSSLSLAEIYEQEFLKQTQVMACCIDIE